MSFHALKEHLTTIQKDTAMFLVFPALEACTAPVKVYHYQQDCVLVDGIAQKVQRVPCHLCNLKEDYAHQEHSALMDHLFLQTALPGDTALKQVSLHQMEFVLLVISALKEVFLVHRKYVLLVTTVQREALILYTVHLAPTSIQQLMMKYQIV